MDFREVISRFGGTHRFAVAIGVGDNTAQSMKTRNMIPSRYWLDVTAAASHQGVKGVTLDALAEISAKRRKRR